MKFNMKIDNVLICGCFPLDANNNLRLIFFTASIQKSSMTTHSTSGEHSMLENNTSYLNDSKTLQDHANIDDLMSSSKLRICLCPPDAELPGFDRNEFT